MGIQKIPFIPSILRYRKYVLIHIIGDKGVAKTYLSLMSDLGVEINSQKTLISSNRSLEFAKQFPTRSDLSPLDQKHSSKRNTSCTNSLISVNSKNYEFIDISDAEL